MSGHQTKSPQKKKCYLLKVLSKETSQMSLIFTHTYDIVVTNVFSAMYVLYLPLISHPI